MTDMPRFLTPKEFGATFHYHRSTVAKWLDGMRRDGVAVGFGKATRIEVGPARRWITESTQKAPAPMLAVIRCEVRQ
jgi:hypothetical protein